MHFFSIVFLLVLIIGHSNTTIADKESEKQDYLYTTYMDSVVLAYPFMVAVHEFQDRPSFLCAGILVSYDLVLTARRCVLWKNDVPLIFNESVHLNYRNNVYLQFGTDYIDGRQVKTPVQFREVSDWNILAGKMGEYINSSLPFEFYLHNDMVLIRVHRQLVPSAFVRPIEISTGPPPTNYCVSLGWGSTLTDVRLRGFDNYTLNYSYFKPPAYKPVFNIHNKLMVDFVHILPANGNCHHSFTGGEINSPSRFYCSLNYNNSTCAGNIGSPLVCDNKLYAIQIFARCPVHPNFYSLFNYERVRDWLGVAERDLMGNKTIWATAFKYNPNMFIWLVFFILKWLLS